MNESWNTVHRVELEPERYELFEDRGYQFDAGSPRILEDRWAAVSSSFIS